MVLGLVPVVSILFTCKWHCRKHGCVDLTTSHYQRRSGTLGCRHREAVQGFRRCCAWPASNRRKTAGRVGGDHATRAKRAVEERPVKVKRCIYINVHYSFPASHSSKILRPSFSTIFQTPITSSHVVLVLPIANRMQKISRSVLCSNVWVRRTSWVALRRMCSFSVNRFSSASLIVEVDGGRSLKTTRASDGGAMISKFGVCSMVLVSC